MDDTPEALARACAAAMWAEDRASQALGMRIVSIAPGHAVVEMPVRTDMTNGHGNGHGGFAFALADRPSRSPATPTTSREVSRGPSAAALARSRRPAALRPSGSGA